jgi:hypothetical protein
LSNEKFVNDNHPLGEPRFKNVHILQKEKPTQSYDVISFSVHGVECRVLCRRRSLAPQKDLYAGLLDNVTDAELKELRAKYNAEGNQSKTSNLMLSASIPLERSTMDPYAVNALNADLQSIICYIDDQNDYRLK